MFQTLAVQIKVWHRAPSSAVTASFWESVDLGLETYLNELSACFACGILGWTSTTLSPDHCSLLNPGKATSSIGGCNLKTWEERENLRLQYKPTESGPAILAKSPSGVYACESTSRAVLKDSQTNSPPFSYLNTLFTLTSVMIVFNCIEQWLIIGDWPNSLYAGLLLMALPIRQSKEVAPWPC